MSQVTAALKKAAQSEDTPQRELKALAEQHVDLARLIARNPAAPEALLRQLGSHEDATVRKWVASHPATPTDVLLALGQQFPEQLLANPILDFLFLENPNLLSDFPDSTIRALMKRRSTPEAILRFGAQSRDEGTQLAVVQNPSAPEELLEHLDETTASSKVKDAIKARREAESDVIEADALFWEAVCGRVAEYGPKKKERQLFEAVCTSAPAAGESIAWLQRRERAHMASIPEADLEEFAEEHNPFVVEDLLAREDLPVGLILRLIPRASTASALNLTKNKTQAPTVLRALSEHEDINVRLGVAKHLSTHMSILESMSIDKASEVRIAVATHASTPASVLESMSTDKAYDVRLAVAKNSQTPVSTLIKLASKKSNKLLHALAGNKNTPNDALRAMIQRDKSLPLNDDVVPYLVKRGFGLPYLMKVALGAIADHPSTSAVILEQLAGDQREQIREKVAGNQSAPVAALAQLARDKKKSVITKVAGNPNTPVSALEQLASDEDEWVRRELASNQASPVALLERLAGDQDPFVRFGVAYNSKTPITMLGRLAGDQDRYKQRGVAMNPNTPVAILELLAANKDSYVCEGVARNPNTPPAVLEQLAGNRDPNIRSSVGGNQNTPKAVLSQLAGDGDRYVIGEIARNPNTPATVLERMAVNKNLCVREELASNPNTPTTACQRLACDRYASVRRKIGHNPSTPLALLNQLVSDKDVEVRRAAASNPAACVFFDDIMQHKALKPGVFEGFLENPNIMPKLEPYIPDFLRLLQGKAPVLSGAEDPSS